MQLNMIILTKGENLSVNILMNLFFSKNNFNEVCGWPSFDRSFPKAIMRLADTGGIRIEIQCVSYIEHLGHVSLGEHLRDRITRMRHIIDTLYPRR